MTSSFPCRSDDSPTAMTELRSFFPVSRRLFFLMLQLACFAFFPPPPARREPRRQSASARSYLRHLLSFSRPSNTKKQQQQRSPKQRENKLNQLRHYLVHPERIESEDDEIQTNAAAVPAAKRRPSVTCRTCGETLIDRAELLDLHQVTKHAFSEIPEGDPGNNIVRIIFLSGWKEAVPPPLVRRVLKIHHSPAALARFEECRDALRNRLGGDSGERCVVDGNERLRFYCATFVCRLDGKKGGTCGSPLCSVCGIVQQGFSAKQVAAEGGISTHATARAANSSLPVELEREFAFLGVRRAMLICRVLAGRVRRSAVANVSPGGEDYDHLYDSAERATGDLLLLNPLAVLPCFVVIYTH